MHQTNGFCEGSPEACAALAVQRLIQRGQTLSAAESCTGGLLAKCITDVAGSSAVFAGACVTYTNETKLALLGVDPAVIAAYTEVSAPCAEAMARGARERMKTDLALATTGYAGPTGGTERDPVGTVYLALATPTGVLSERFSAPPGSTRAQVRNTAAARALTLLFEYMNEFVD